MKKAILLCVFLSAVMAGNAQRARYKVDSANVKDPYGLYLSVGGVFSGIDIYKNYFSNPRRFGWHTRLSYEFSNTFRVVGEFSRIPQFEYWPSWNRLGAHTLDLNLQFMARIKDEYSIFYSFLGICKHGWSGQFVKSSWYKETKDYAPGTLVSGGWLGMNIGLGVERAFKHFELYLDYRYRFTTTYNVFSVADVALQAGIKKKIPLKAVFRKPGDRYGWF